MPPHIAVRKAIRKVKTRYWEARSRRADAQGTTFEPRVRFPVRPLVSIVKDLSSDPALFPAKLIRDYAEHFIRHEFNLLGSGWVRVTHGLECKGVEERRFPPEIPVTADSEGRWLKGRVNSGNLEQSQRLWGLIEQHYVPIDWQLDFKSGFRWDEKTWSMDIRYGHLPGVDVKVPWELARAQHLPQLALAFGLSRDAKEKEVLRREFRNQVLDFMSTNPPRFGVNWSCTMDVGIRTANWLLAYDLFVAFGTIWDEPFEKAFAESVFAHASHIYNHLEWDPDLRSNHYLADIVGLLFASAYLPKSKTADHWLGFSASELRKEVESQFHEEGSNFEASTSYHRLSAEMVIYGTALLLGLPEEKEEILQKKFKILFPESYLKRLERMAEFAMDYSKPDGTAAQIGDNDSGRFLKFLPDRGGVLDHRHLVAAIAGLYPREDFLKFSEGWKGETLLVGALSGGKYFNAHPRVSSSAFVQYPRFGLYRLSNEIFELIIRCGDVGQKGNGGHAHNDQLSFELAVNGVSVMVDPGTYLYTALPDERNLFRSTAAHNTLTIKGKEQNPWERGTQGLFRLMDKARGRVFQIDENKFVGEHGGFNTPYIRTFRIQGEVLEVDEECAANGKQVTFHFAPGGTLKRNSLHEAQWSKGSVKVLITVTEGYCSTVEDGFYSSAYGEKEPAPVLALFMPKDRMSWKIKVMDN